MQVCEVCQRPFRAINLNHLRTHGIVSWTQYEEIVARRLKPDQTLIREVALTLLHRQEVPEEQARKLAEINAAQRMQVPAMLGAFNLRRVIRVQKLMEQLEAMENVAFEKESLENLAAEQLLELMKFASGDIEKMIKQLSEESKDKGFAGAVDSIVNNNTYHFVNASGNPTVFDGRLPDDPRARAGLMEQVNRLLSVAENNVIETTAQKNEPQHDSQPSGTGGATA